MAGSQPWGDLLPEVARIAVRAGEVTLPYFHGEKPMQSDKKADHTWVTKADLAADELIREALQQLTPDIPAITEETAAHYSWSLRQNFTTYWLVDPLDGTRGFRDHRQYYTINIALIHDHQPVLAAVYCPTNQALFSAVIGAGAFCTMGAAQPERIQTRALDWGQLSVVLGAYLKTTHWKDIFAKVPGSKIHHVNSSYKLCLVASGEHDIYPRRGQISEWDTAATQIILEEAGGALVDCYGQPLSYNRQASLVNPPFVALGDCTQLTKVLALVFPESA